MAELVGQQATEGDDGGFVPMQVGDGNGNGAAAGPPCDWPLLGLDGCDALDGHPLAAEVAAMAVAYLWNWTGRVFGLCEVTVRPCRVGCAESTTFRGVAGNPSVMPSVGGLWEPALVGGVWRNLACGRCRAGCECDQVEAVRLPSPVHDIVSVTVDGELLDPSAYRVDNAALLVRDDGGRWPACQALHLPDGEPGTWSVTFRWGKPVPVGGQVAAGLLACEMGKALMDDASCGLPERLQTITREGVTMAVLDPFEGLQDGRTGLWLVDSWVGSLTHTRPRSTVHSPDRRQQTTSTTYRGGA
jgi:hypothetical protein